MQLTGDVNLLGQGLDELRTITARLCGELPLEGFARWKEEYDRAHIMA